MQLNFRITNIEWDTDGETDINLPKKCYIPLKELLYKDENLSDTTREELKNRVADYLSDKYEFYIKGLLII